MAWLPFAWLLGSLLAGGFAHAGTQAAPAPDLERVHEAIASAQRAERRGDTLQALELWELALERAAPTEGDARLPTGPEAELALRALFRLAGRLDDYRRVAPLFERLAQRDETPALAATARLLAGAAAASTGQDVAHARSLWKPLGFLERWWLIGPFDNERGGGFRQSFGPEGDARPDESSSHAGKNRQVAWRRLPVTPTAGWVDLDVLMYPSDQALAYAMTFVHSERDAEAVIALGSDEGYCLWVNGELVASRDLHRLMRTDQDHVPIRLRAGWNSVLLKVAEDEGRWEFTARIAAPDGGPLDGWREDAPPADAELPPVPSKQAVAPASDSDDFSFAAPQIRAVRARLANDEDDAWSHFLLGALLQEQRAHDLARHPDREALERAIALHGDPVPATWSELLATTSLRQRGVTADRDDNAWRRALESAANAEPPSASAAVELARYALDSFGNLERAETLVGRALEINPSYADARILAARIRARRGVPNALARELERCHAEGLRTADTVRHRAGRLRDAGRGDEAETLLRELLAGNRFDTRTRADLLGLLEDAGRREDAITFVREAFAYRPLDLDARHDLVRILESGEDLEAAVDAQREIVTIAAGHPEEHRKLGALLWRAHQRDEALASWELALELQPNMPELRQRLDFIRSRRDPFVEEFRRDVQSLVRDAISRPLDGDDPYEVLLDVTAIEVNPDGTSKQFRQQVIRILNDAGARAFDRYGAYYAGDDERLEYKVVRVTHRDGREERARLRVFSPGRGGGGTYRAASIDVPPLEPGAVLEAQFVQEEVRQSFFGDYFGHREYCQGDAPMAEKVFVLRVPAGREFYVHARGLDAVPEVRQDDAMGTVTRTWTLRDVPKLSPEPGMPPNEETLPRIEISTFADWAAFSSWYENLIRKQFESSPEIRAKVGELVSGATSDLERIRALYHFVVQEIRYNAWEFGVHGFKPYNAPTIFARRFGDCKDKATLLTTMLREVGIESYPVLIKSTESRGEEDLTLPMVNHFNHCITYVPPGEGHEGFFLDGTAQYNGLDELPVSDRGARVLVVKPGGGEVVGVAWNEPDEMALDETIDVAVHSDRSATLDVRLEARGDFAAALRRFFEIEGQRKTNFERVYGVRFAGLSVEELSLSDLTDLAAPVRMHARVRVPTYLQVTAGGLALPPPDDFFGTNGGLQTVASLENRTWDVLLGGPRRARLVVTWELPAGLEPSSTPDGVSITDRFGRLECHWSYGDDTLRATRELDITAPRVGREDYPRFRALAASLGRLAEQRVVLKQRG